MRSCADRSWQELSQILLGSPASLPPRVAVLAAHPDDETIGASSLLARLRETTVIYLTDGAPRDRKLWSPQFRGTRAEYAALRRVEAERALGIAGIPQDRMHWLGAVDQETIFSVDDLVRRLAEVLARVNADVLITHPYEGGHPDHDSAALIARLAISRLHPDQTPLLAEMTSYHARNCQCVTGQFLSAAVREEICVALSADERERKQQMFAAYASQRLVLEGFTAKSERFRPAPNYDFSRPPHEGKLWYECMGWAMTGDEWRKLATQSILRAEEVACR